MTGICGTDPLGKSLSMCYFVHVVYRAVTEKQIQSTVKTAHQYGGSFISKLAEAALAGDPRNRDRVLRAFPEIVAQYGPGSVFYNETL